MFERFTERARRVIILAQEEAKRLNHSAVGTEHILLGIIREGEGVASKVLESLNIVPDRVRAEIESAIGRGERTPYEEVAFTPRAKKVLELALDEARRLGHNYIGTEHLLLGLVREGQSTAARVLVAQGAGLAAVRSQVMRAVSGPGVADPGTAPVSEPDEARQSWQEVGWAVVAAGTSATWRVLGMARAQAAADERRDVEVDDLVAGALRSGDPVLDGALADAGGPAPGGSAQDSAADTASSAPPVRPLSQPAQEALAGALRLAEGDGGSLRPGHLLLGCLAVLDEGALRTLAARLDVELGQLATHVTDRLRSGRQ